MNLLLDIGNTRVKWRLLNAAGEVLKNAAFSPDEEGIEDFLAQLQAVDVSSLWVAEVGNVFEPFALLTRIKAIFPTLVCHNIRSEAECLGVKNSYAEPYRLGVDRWLSAVEAWHASAGVPVAVFDFGTAAKLDVVAEGQHQGGHIVPGLNMMRQALTQNTSKVRFQAQHSFEQGWGCSTAAAVENGTWVMLMAWLERELQAFIDKYPAGEVYILGGDAEYFSQSQLLSTLNERIHYADNLVLQALWRLVRND
mgnify:CR=1 FL=1